MVHSQAERDGTVAVIDYHFDNHFDCLVLRNNSEHMTIACGAAEDSSCRSGCMHRSSP